MNLLNYFAILTILVSPSLQSIQGGTAVCPSKYYAERDHHYPYVVYGTNPPQCYVASRQGPCDDGSVLFAKPNSHLGVCSCSCFLSDGIEFDDTLGNTYDHRYCYDQGSGHVFVYDRSRRNCYRLGSQGPCGPGEIFYKDIYAYDFTPKCVREDVTNETHTEIEREKCPPGTIYSTLLNICTDMNFKGLNQTGGGSSNNNTSGGCNNSTSSSSSPRPTPLPPGKCPEGTILSTLLNKCTDMRFTGLPPGGGNGWTSTSRPTGNKCPEGTIYSTLLNKCTDMSFTGLPPGGGGGWTSTSRPNGNKCPDGTIYSTLLNKCTDMSFTGLPPGGGGWTSTSRPTGNKCPEGTIYSTLLNKCTDMSFTGLPPGGGGGWTSTSRPGKCPEGTIYSTLLNKCTDMSFTGLPPGGGGWASTSKPGKCPQGSIYSTLLNRCTDMSFRGLVATRNHLL